MPSRGRVISGLFLFFFKEKKIQRKEKRSSPPAMKEKAECGFQRFHKGRIQLQALM